MNDEEVVRTIMSAPISYIFEAWRAVPHAGYAGMSHWYFNLQGRNHNALVVARTMLPLIVAYRLRS